MWVGPNSSLVIYCFQFIVYSPLWFFSLKEHFSLYQKCWVYVFPTSSVARTDDKKSLRISVMPLSFSSVLFNPSSNKSNDSPESSDTVIGLTLICFCTLCSLVFCFPYCLANLQPAFYLSYSFSLLAPLGVNFHSLKDDASILLTLCILRISCTSLFLLWIFFLPSYFPSTEKRA